MSSTEAFYGINMYFITFETFSPFIAIICEMTPMPLSCETPAVFCGLKKLKPTFHWHWGGLTNDRIFTFG